MNAQVRKERPILFRKPHPALILEDLKWQTRRPVKDGQTKCPYGDVGDLLWVKERWRYCEMPEIALSKYKRLQVVFEDHLLTRWLFWENSPISAPFSAPIERHIARDGADRKRFLRVRQAIFMPKIVACIWLEIVEVRQERLHDISDADCLAEGGYTHNRFRAAWDEMWGGGEFAVELNPLVWVVSFRKIETPACSEWGNVTPQPWRNPHDWHV